MLDGTICFRPAARLAGAAAILMSALLCLYSPCQGAKDVSLDGEWDFAYTVASAAEVPEAPPASSFDAKMPVPGRWDDHLENLRGSRWFGQAKFVPTIGPLSYLSGVGWYRKTLDAPDAWRGRSLVLEIGWAPGITHLWVNGGYVGRYDYGVYTPFSFDVSSLVKPGRPNEITIALDNTRGFAGGWNYYPPAGRASGIFRPVTMKVSGGRGRISDLWMRPGSDLKEVIWNAEISVPEGGAAVPASQIHWDIRSADGRSLLASGTARVPAFSMTHKLTWKKRVASVKPWSDREPNLYRTTVRWVVGDGEWDSTSQRFGLRRWTSVGRKLFLNGLPVYIRGDFGPTTFPNEVSTPTTRPYYEAYFRALKQAGMNEVNFSHKVPPPEMLEVADEMGVFVMGGDETTAFETDREHYKEVWEPIVRNTRRYPSMCLYGFGGEHDYYEGAIEQFQKQYDFIKSLYPECLVVPQQAIRGVDYSFDEKGARELTQKPFPHHAARLAQYTKACDVFGHYSGGAFGYTLFDTPWREMDERFTIYDKPLVVHETYMRGSYLRPGNAARYTGRDIPWMYTKLEDDLKKAGLLSKWPTYFDHSGRLNAIVRKYCQEKARKPDSMIGYELLGLLDQNFQPSYYPCGIADEFMQIKPGESWERLQRYMGENLLLIDYAGDSLNRSFYGGEPFAADLMISLYGPRPVASGTLEWALKDGQKSLSSGTQKIARVPNGAVTTLAKIRLAWPRVQKTTKVNLSVRFSGSGYSISNDWDFWVFRKFEAPDVAAEADEFCHALLSRRYKGVTPMPGALPGKLRIVSKIDEADVAYLEQGGDVVLLGTQPFARIGPFATYPGHSGIAAGNAGAIIREHPILRDLPDEGWGDWHYMPLLRPAACIRLDDVDSVFDPIIEIISSPTEPRKQAALLEKRVGKGRLLVSTSTIDLTNPSCAAFMDGLLAYVTGDVFQPASELTAESLRDLLAPPPARDPANLLGFGDFERPQEISAALDAMGSFETDKTVAHGGKRSLKLVPNSFVDAGTRVRFPKSPRALKLSAWCKADGLEGESGKDFQVYVYLSRPDGSRERFALPLETGTHDWQYTEVTYVPQQDATGASVNIGYSKAMSGTAWLDDVFLGEDKDALSAIAASKREWHNKTAVIEFGKPIYARLDDGPWGQRGSVTISTEGIHKLYTSETEDHSAAPLREIGIDLTPPAIEMKTEPLLTQLGGVYYATPATLFSLTASDDLSGVKSIEIKTDGGEFRPYSAPFQLPVGTHRIECRAVDNAGNEELTIGGAVLSGGKTTAALVVVRQDG